jgi:hypothetical protein
MNPNFSLFSEALIFFVTSFVSRQKSKHNVKRPHAEPAEVKTTQRLQRTHSNCTATHIGLGKKASRNLEE